MCVLRWGKCPPCEDRTKRTYEYFKLFNLKFCRVSNDVSLPASPCQYLYKNMRMANNLLLIKIFLMLNLCHF